MTTQPAGLLSRAPDPTLFTLEGAQIQLSNVWRAQPVLFFFLRHFGCAICRAELGRLRQHYSDFQARGATIVAIAPSDAMAAALFARRQQLPFQMLADPRRLSYQAFGLEEASLWEVAGPEILVRQAREALKGNIASINPFGPSINQLGGCFIVDRQGMLRFSHIARPIFNYPPIEEYLAIFDEL